MSNGFAATGFKVLHRRRLLSPLLQFLPGREDYAAFVNQFLHALIGEHLEVGSASFAGFGCY